MSVYFLQTTLQHFEVDCAAKPILIPILEFKKVEINREMSPSVQLHLCPHHFFNALGAVHVKVQYKGRCIRRKMLIVPDGYAATIHQDWICGLDLDLKEIDIDARDHPGLGTQEIKSVSAETLANEVLTNYAELFEERIRRIPNYEVKLS